MTDAIGTPFVLDGVRGNAPDWVHLVPAGTFSGADGRGPYKADAPALVQACMGKEGKMPPMVVDFVHQTHLAAARGGAAPAAGWIVEVQARADGVWGRVDWTPGGKRALGEKEYRFISPVFEHKADGTVTMLRGASLVNAPNLVQLTALNSATPAAPDGDDAEPDGIDVLLRRTRDLAVPDEASIYAACGLQHNPKEGT